MQEFYNFQSAEVLGCHVTALVRKMEKDKPAEILESLEELVSKYWQPYDDMYSKNIVHIVLYLTILEIAEILYHTSAYVGNIYEEQLSCCGYDSYIPKTKKYLVKFMESFANSVDYEKRYKTAVISHVHYAMRSADEFHYGNSCWSEAVSSLYSKDFRADQIDLLNYIMFGKCVGCKNCIADKDEVARLHNCGHLECEDCLKKDHDTPLIG